MVLHAVARLETGAPEPVAQRLRLAGKEVKPPWLPGKCALLVNLSPVRIFSCGPDGAVTRTESAKPASMSPANSSSWG
jgi:hypothetical protein